MTLRGSYRDLLRRVGAVEELAEWVAPAHPGCDECAGLPDLAMLDQTEPGATQSGYAPWYCRAWSRPDGRDCRGCPECSPTSGWPPDLRCGACGRTPEYVVRIEYAEHPEGYTVAHAPDRAALYDRYGGDEPEEH